MGELLGGKNIREKVDSQHSKNFYHNNNVVLQYYVFIAIYLDDFNFI